MAPRNPKRAGPGRMAARLAAVALTAALASPSLAADVAKPAAILFATEPDGTVHMPAMDVPFSSLASDEARQAFVKGVVRARDQFDHPARDIAGIRQQASDALGELLAASRARYPVTIAPRVIAGVYTDDVLPVGGVSAANKSRVLINLHGGGFFSGARISGKVEAVPVASVGRIEVIAVDYRQGPENKFPAASEDVTAVYKALLQTHKPAEIGIYGCSAGGMLVTEVVAWLQKEKLPLPGAVGVFCASASGWAGGDSNYQATSYGMKVGREADPKFAVSDVAYFTDADMSDPMVAPIRSPAIMARFPPTLVITGTRDSSMSSAIHTHAVLVRLGVDAELHVWEGMGHGFFFDPSTPEAREAYSVIATFFDRHLAR